MVIEEAKWAVNAQSYNDGSWLEFYEQKVEAAKDRFRIYVQDYQDIIDPHLKLYKIETGLYQLEGDDEGSEVIENSKKIIEEKFEEKCSYFVNSELEWSVVLYFETLVNMYETLVQLKTFLEELYSFLSIKKERVL